MVVVVETPDVGGLLNVAGVETATSFHGDGHNLQAVTSKTCRPAMVQL